MSERQAGYTLLEMLVALVVFGLVMAGVAQTMRFGLAAFSASDARGAAPENLAALDQALTRMIGSALPESLHGEPGGLAFTTRLPAGAGIGPGLADAAIRLSPDGDLILLYRPHPPGVPLGPPPPAQTELLAPGVTAFALSYFGARNRQPPAWSGSWLEETPPALVRLHMSASRHDWPDLVIAVDPQGG